MSVAGRFFIYRRTSPPVRSTVEKAYPPVDVLVCQVTLSRCTKAYTTYKRACLLSRVSQSCRSEPLWFWHLNLSRPQGSRPTTMMIPISIVAC